MTTSPKRRATSVKEQVAVWLFDIQIERDLLTVDGRLRDPREVYRKVVPKMDAEAEAELESLGD